MLTVKILEQIWTDESFSLFWKKIEVMKSQLDVDEPQLQRKRKAPKRYEIETASSEFPSTVEDQYRCIYFEALDLAVTCIKSRFDQKGYKTFSHLEQLFYKACRGECFSEELDFVHDYFYDDFNKDDLAAELITLRQLYHSSVGDELPSVKTIKTALSSLSSAQRMLLTTASKLFQMLLILPATNATSEQSFSALHRVKLVMIMI